jgi:hypothetical protein
MLQRCAPPPNPVAMASSCWTSSEELKALIQEVLLDILATNPDAFPVPPGVTDGSLAPTGYPGEVFSFTVPSASFAGATSGATVAPAVNYITGFSLPPGDWDAQWRLRVDAQSPNGPQAAACWLTLPPVGVLDMMEGQPNIPSLMTPYPGPPGGSAPALGFQPLTIISASYPINIKAALGAVFNMCVWSGVATGTYGFHFWARRRR